MGCSVRNFGPVKAQSKLSVFLTMILLFTYLFYCLNGYCDSQVTPRAELRARDGEGQGARRGNNASSSALVRWGTPPGEGNMSVANSFGSKKFPQAIIIGVKKGGTRALLEFLRIHPDVRAVGAEPHFFDRFYDKGLEWYR